ncbi:CMP-N-acetylneuraminate-poly-alpha-2,8-sialyltransferase-like [Branchiostoma floridae]|uniref:CMP-N-acetylneuraminate-poly-alpha-2, 8-sialyltransferase-like n=1 Tax=Branchiostoma floridae TaxID=7739 RepID=A0A9J7M8R8_BRAFL|nr:CMP-N-acetylneuraminate-poly-alpha-2,8-sialyltransferase-like [Branchiostoma floridae]
MRKGSRKLQRSGLKRNRMSPHHGASSGLVTLQRIRTAAVSIGPAYFTTVTMDEWGNISEQTVHVCTSHGQKSCIPANGHDSGRIRTCAIVGSGGILTGSLCGTNIDANEYVIRFNLAPTVGFEQDVGNKANLTILNKEILDRVKASLKSKDSEGFASRLKQMKTSIFLYAKGRRTDLFRSLLQLAWASNISITLDYIEAHYLTAKIIMKIFPRYDRDFDSYVTTGLIGVVLATTLCNKITLYGFYPFNTDPLTGRNLSYHYYLNIDGNLGEPNNKVHDYKTEYKLLRALEKRRLLTLVKEPCHRQHVQRNIR